MEITTITESRDDARNLGNDPVIQEQPPPIGSAKVVLGRLGGVFVLFILFAWPSLTLLYEIYEAEDDYSHGMLVPLVSAYATYEILRSTPTIRTSFAWIGIPFFLGGVFTMVLGHWYYIALFPYGLGVGFLRAVGICLCITGFFVMWGGIVTLKTFFFPLSYLIFAVPFPKSLTLPITLKLREIVSILGEWAIRGTGLTIFREGNVLHLANASLGVADACSGIRSFWMLTAGAAALAYILKLRPVKACVICLAPIPISIAMNTLRVVVTATLVSRYGIQFASGWRHDICGWFTFGLGLILLIAIACFLAGKGSKCDSTSAPSSISSIHWPALMSPKTAVFMVICSVVLASGVFANLAISRHYDAFTGDVAANRSSFSSFPEEIGDFTLSGQGTIPELHQQILMATDFLIRTYRTKGGDEVELRLIYWDPLKHRRQGRAPGVDFHIPDVCFPCWGFTRIKEFDSDVKIERISKNTVSLRQYRKSGRVQCVLYWYKAQENVLSQRNILWRLRVLYESWTKPFLNHGPEYVVTLISDGTNSFEKSKATVRRFAESLAPHLPNFGID